MPKMMDAIAQSGAGNLTQTIVRMGAMQLAAVSREGASMWRSHIAVSRHVPRIFQRQGLLWWFQVLTTYLVRIREPLSSLLAKNPAMKPFLLPPGPLAFSTKSALPSSWRDAPLWEASLCGDDTVDEHLSQE